MMSEDNCYFIDFKEVPNEGSTLKMDKATTTNVNAGIWFVSLITSRNNNNPNSN